MSDSSQKLIVSQTTLPDIFVIRYAGGLSADAIYAYLWINSFYHNKSFEIKDIYNASILSKTAADNALAELVLNDLLIRNGVTFHQTDIITKEVDEYYSYRKAYNDSVGGIPEDMSERNLLAGSIQDTFFQGKMSYVFYALIDKCLFEYSFEQPVVYSLFQEGLDNGYVKKIGEMRNLAKRWYEKGITTSKALSEYKQIDKEVNNVVKILGKLCRRRMNAIDIERITKWVIDLHCSPELIEFAYRANEFRGNIQMIHVEETLLKWTSANITTVEEAKKYEEENHKENKRKATKRKARYSGAVTGLEAGIDSADEEETKPSSTTEEEDKPAFGADNGSEFDNILDIFGGEDD